MCDIIKPKKKYTLTFECFFFFNLSYHQVILKSTPQLQRNRILAIFKTRQSFNYQVKWCCLSQANPRTNKNEKKMVYYNHLTARLRERCGSAKI